MRRMRPMLVFCVIFVAVVNKLPVCGGMFAEIGVYSLVIN